MHMVSFRKIYGRLKNIRDEILDSIGEGLLTVDKNFKINFFNRAAEQIDEQVNQVETLLSGDHEAGTYEVDFDATGLSSGIYFYQIKSAPFTETRNLVLMK